MTSVVKVTAHCPATVEVLCTKICEAATPDEHLSTPPLEILLQDGESTEVHVYGNQVVTVRERPKST